jgi:hypothetical protein
VTLDARNPRAVALTNDVFATTLSPAAPLKVPHSLRRAVGVVGDVLLLAAVVGSIPFVILAVGIPIALTLRLLLWFGGML